MRIRLDRFGGFHAPAMRLSCSLDTKELSSQEVADLALLIEEARLDENQKATSDPQRAPAQFEYEMEIEPDEGEVTCVVLDDLGMTEAAQKLVHWVEHHAKGPRK